MCIVESEPEITAGKHVTCVNHPPGMALTCAARYSGSELMPLVMRWTTDSGLQLTNRTVNHSSTFMSSTCLPPSSSISAAESSSSSFYTCTVTFSRPSAHTVFRGVHSEYYLQKSNAPSLTVSSIYHVQQGE